MNVELLQKRQAYPLDLKIAFTVKRLKEFYYQNSGKVYLCLSGGKDSQVLAHIIKKHFGDKIPLVFVNTLNEHVSVMNKARELLDVELKPKMTVFQIMKTRGIPFPTKQQAHFLYQAKTTKSDYLRSRLMNGIMKDGSKTQFKVSEKYKVLLDLPFTFSDVCCEILKKRPLKKYQKETGNKPIVGSMACESNQRRFKYLKNGCITESQCTPIAFWNEQDILKYIYVNNLDIAEIYGSVELKEGVYSNTGVDRTGCQVCYLGIQYDSTPNRLQRMKQDNFAMWDYLMNKENHKIIFEAMNIAFT